jgi:regulator of replication initiation timing
MLHLHALVSRPVRERKRPSVINNVMTEMLSMTKEIGVLAEECKALREENKRLYERLQPRTADQSEHHRSTLVIGDSLLRDIEATKLVKVRWRRVDEIQRCSR